MDLVARFLARVFGPTRSKRLELRLYPEERAAFDRAAVIAGDLDASTWARRTLTDAARRQIKGAR